MRPHRWLAALIVPAAVLTGVAPAAAGSRPGERYDGLSATGERVYLRVTRDGKALQRYDFVVSTRCSDGRRRTQGLFDRGEGPARITADGSFSYRSAAQPLTYRGAGVRGLARLAFEGAFDATGQTVTGVIRATFRSKRFRCSSGPVTFTAHLDGSPGAPWRDATMATGRYDAAGRGVQMRLQVLAPGRLLVRARIDWRAGCGGAGRLTGENFYGYFGVEGDRLSVPGRGTRRVEPGITARERWRLELRFDATAGYRVTGRWRITSTVFRRGVRIARCKLDVPVSGSFVNGPE